MHYTKPSLEFSIYLYHNSLRLFALPLLLTFLQYQTIDLWLVAAEPRRGAF